MGIDRIIRDLEEQSVEYAVVGDIEMAKRTRLLASKYREMKYNGHLTILKEEKEYKDE
tara:strand:+ start:1471 stop:1644 length:174 start_codon:yes stop_codon:yes gene_type:complete